MRLEMFRSNMTERDADAFIATLQSQGSTAAAH
jgi:hypothetical protein